MTIALGLFISLLAMLGGFVAMGGYLSVLMQPWEFVIIGGMALGTFIVANPMPVIKDTGKALGEAFANKAPKDQDYLDLLGLLFSLMQEIKSKTRAEVEQHIDSPEESAIFSQYPNILKDKQKVDFIADYVRLIIIGNARPHEIEGLMDEELHTIEYDKLKPYHSMQAVSDGLPALGIVAA
ncbi:MAG: motility-associated protein, partial [Nitratireductor sp.]